MGKRKQTNKQTCCRSPASIREVLSSSLSAVWKHFPLQKTKNPGQESRSYSTNSLAKHNIATLQLF